MKHNKFYLEVESETGTCIRCVRNLFLLLSHKVRCFSLQINSAELQTILIATAFDHRYVLQMKLQWFVSLIFSLVFH